jgi:capsular polysaccharide biosynthesis protein
MAFERREGAIPLRDESDLEWVPPSGHDVGVPRVELLWAVRRHWITALLPILVLGGMATAYGLNREPEYTATTRLVVGRVDAGTPTSALAGFTAATQALAETYSRMATGDAITRSVAARLDGSANTVKRNVRAAPVPNTPVFRVTGTGSTPEAAVRYSVLASEALTRRVRRQARSSPRGARLFRRYRAAALDKSIASERLDELEAALADPADITRARASLETASLRAEALRRSFVESTQNQTGTAEPQIVDRASSATSDRNSFLQLILFVAIASGALVGIGLAFARANRDARRLFDDRRLRAVPEAR